MYKGRKKFIVALAVILITTSLLLTTVQRGSAFSESTTDDPFIIMEYGTEEISYIRSASIIDNVSRVHFFLQINYFNGSFVILHILEDILITVETGRSASSIFEAYRIDENIVLVYSLESQIYRNVVKLYMWNDLEHSSSTIYNSSEYYFYPKIFMSENSIHLMTLNVDYYEEPPDVVLHHVRIFFNGTSVEKSIEVPFWGDEYDVFVLDDQAFMMFKKYNYNETSRYYDSTTLSIVGVTDQGFYNSTVYEIDDVWFSSQLSVCSDGKFYFSYVSYGILYTTKFSINESITPSSFKQFNFNSYYFYGYFDVFSYTNTTYLVYQDFGYYWLEDAPYYYYYNPDRKVKTLTLNIIVDDNISMYQRVVELEDYPYLYQFGSVNYDIIENGSYSIGYSVILESQSFDNMKFLSEYVFAWKVYTDLTLNLPTTPFLYGIKSYSSFAYFWIKYWYTVISPIIVLSILYVIFRKRINRGIKKMIRYLLRPIIPNAKKSKLVAVNLWLFVKNSSSLIMILWKANKRRLIISLLGLTILSTIIVTSTTLFDSKRTSLIINYVESADLYNDDDLSASYNLILSDLSSLGDEGFNLNITEYAFSEIFHSLNTKTSVLRSIITGVYYTMNIPLMNLNFTDAYSYPLGVSYYGLNDNYSVVIEELLTEGRLPIDNNEVIVASSFIDEYAVEINDTLSFNATSFYEVFYPTDFSKANFTVVGIYQDPSENLLTNICNKYSLPSDPLTDLTSSYYRIPTMLTFTSSYLTNLENVTSYNLNLYSQIQFLYDFSQMDTDRLNILLEEIQDIVGKSPYSFNFAPNSYWYIQNELQYVFSGIGSFMQMTQFIIVFLSIPILYLALFVTFEVNEIFSSSFEQEIRILSSKGVSTGMITFIYSTMKFFEALAATFLGLGVNLIILPPLLKIDKFITFKSVFTSIQLATAPAAMGITLLLLIIISVPRIIKLSTTKKEVEKPPKKFVHLMKTIKLPYILITGFGAGFIGLGWWLIESSYLNIIDSSSLALLTIYIYIIGIGVMISLLGLGLLLREVHKIFMIAISKVFWSLRKNLFTFSLVEVRSDIKLFNNTFLTYVILVGLLIPFTITPLLIQDKINTETYFYGGSDLIITNWDDYNDTILSSFSNYSEIVSYTNITQLNANYRDYPIDFLIVNDTVDYLKTAFQPPEYLFRNWEQSIYELRENTSMLTSNTFKDYVAGGQNQFSFINDTGVDPIVIPFSIKRGFDYFPIFYDYGSERFGSEPYGVSYDVYYPEPYPYTHFGIVMSQDNFEYISGILTLNEVTLQRLLINVKNSVNQEKFADTLRQDLGVEVDTMETNSDLALFTFFPFYSVLVAEFVFGILICLAAVAFTSLSNPLKILQRRLVKHDILKKIGIPTNRIIFLSALELFVSCIVLGLALGGAAGYGLLSLFNWLFIESPAVQGGLPFQMHFPYQVMLIIFLAIPVVFYTIFFLAMKYNFAKYRPKNLE